MKLWFVRQDGKRQLYTDPRTGASELTRKRGEEIGERMITQPEIQQVELADQIGLIHWWRRKRESSVRPRSQPFLQRLPRFAIPSALDVVGWSTRRSSCPQGARTH